MDIEKSGYVFCTINGVISAVLYGNWWVDYEDESDDPSYFKITKILLGARSFAK